MNRLIAAFPTQLQHAYSAADMVSNFETAPRSISSLMGAEGLHQIGNSASVMRLYHQLGVRYITLTHDCNNIYADAALANESAHGGLSSAGRKLILEMNRIGMLIDLSHTSDATMTDTLKTTLAPVIFSHSSSRAVCEHVRNVPDSVLLQVRDNGGLVMVSFYPEYTNCESPQAASLADVVDHMIYIGNLIGFQHVGIGSDFDGMSHGPKGLEDVSKYPKLIEELIKRGLDTMEIEGVLERNILRVLSEAEKVASTLNHISPLEDEIKYQSHYARLLK